MPKFVHAKWNGTQHSAFAASAIVSGIAQAGKEVRAKWQGKLIAFDILIMYAQRICKTNNKQTTEELIYWLF